MSNSKVLWLVSSLFVLVASQCGFKKEAHNRVPANSADKSYERDNGTSVEMANNSPHEVRKSKDDGPPGPSVSESDSRSVGSDTDRMSQLSDEQRVYVEKIGEIAGEFSKFLNGDDYKYFLSNYICKEQGDALLSILSNYWAVYYRPCARIWLYLSDLGLVEKYRKERLFDNGSLSNATENFIAHLVWLLWDRDHVYMSPYVQEYQRMNANDVDAKYNPVKYLFYYLGSINQPVIDELGALFGQTDALNDENEIIISNQEFGDSIDSLKEFPRVWQESFWVFYMHNAPSKVALGLTRIEWYLKKLFGENFDKYRKASNESNPETVLEKLIAFYKGESHGIAYAELPNMGFDQLRDQVKSALQQT